MLLVFNFFNDSLRTNPKLFFCRKIALVVGNIENNSLVAVVSPHPELFLVEDNCPWPGKGIYTLNSEKIVFLVSDLRLPFFIGVFAAQINRLGDAFFKAVKKNVLGIFFNQVVV